MTGVRTAAAGTLGAIAILALLAGVTGSGDVGAAPDDGPPNILIIVTDDQRLPGTLEVMPKTESWFKHGGTYFSSAVTTTPTCCPARSSILTGRYAHNHGVHTSERGQAEALDHDTTLPRYLHEAGYTTGMLGKFLNGWRVEEPPPYFDSWALFSTGPTKAYYGAEWNVEGKLRRIKRYSTDFVADRAVKFLNRSEAIDDQPWFLYVAPNAPHAPSIPEPEYADAEVPPFDANPAVLEEDLSDKPPYVQENPRKEVDRMADKNGKQLRTLMSVDDLVDETMQTLHDLDESHDTLAFFISDNGFLLGEHGLGGKRYPYDPSVEVPMFMRWPDHVAEGAVDDRLVANIDIAPTVFEAVGIEPDHVVDGRSLFDTAYARGRILIEHWLRSKRTTPDWAGLRTSSYVYVEYFAKDSERLISEYEEYYDVLSDPYQLENLLGDTDDDNDPQTLPLSIQLIRDFRCEGTSGPQACP
ncbi:MAG: sulfatase family protein [Actinomycetota bacterium]